MITHPLSGTPTSAQAIPAPSPSTGLTFSDMLTQVQASQGIGGAGQVSARDEDEALKELFHLVAMLTLGIIDGGALQAHETAPGERPGPQRQKVEELKEVLRRLTQGGQYETDSSIDPVTGKRRPGKARASLQALLDALPADLRNLIRHALPNLDELVRADSDPALPTSGTETARRTSAAASVGISNHRNRSVPIGRPGNGR